jgi:hypothetical protein
MSPSCLLASFMMLIAILVSTVTCNAENQAVVSYVQSAGADSRVASDYLILPIGDRDRFDEHKGTFRYNRRTLDCYGKRWGIPVRYVDPKDVQSCPKYQDWFFRRVCVQAAIVESLQNTERGSLFDLKLAKAPKWIIYLDGDTIVTNNNVSIAKASQEWGDKHLVFYERFHNGEIMAGNPNPYPSQYQTIYINWITYNISLQ